MSESLTFGEGADVFGQRCQTHVVLRGESVAVQGFGPGVSVTGQYRGAALPHSYTHAPTRLDEPVDAGTAEFRKSPLHNLALLQPRIKLLLSTGQKRTAHYVNTLTVPRLNPLHVPVEADGSDERADEGPGLRMTAGVEQRPPVVRARNRFLQTAVAQQVRQTHLRVRHVLADAHLRRDGDAACGLAQVEGPGEGRQSDQEQQASQMHDPDRGVEH